LVNQKKGLLCPYCLPSDVFNALNPDTMLIHIINKHTHDEYKEYKEKYYQDTIKIFKRTQNHVYGLAAYLTFLFILFGLLCYFTWIKSDIFSVFGWNWTNPSLNVNPKTFQLILYSIGAGGIGSVSYSLWGLFEHYCRKGDFDSIWTVWYLFGPFSGSIAGIATYAVIIGGLFILGEDISLKSTWSMFAFAFLTGFSTKRALRKMHTIAGHIFEKAEEKT
jgi:hypothetical protein